VHVVATAGHVDHGKSTLIEALTGQQPDRLRQERERGLSIELGYCWTTLPRAGDVAFVDVPGHERFVSTMMAGVGPVPTTLFVVAADDPWMPQAAEHLAVLDALRIRRGVLVVTRSDLADPEPALPRARAELARTSMASVPDVVVSGATGLGLDELRKVLDDVLVCVDPPDPSAPVRLWVDRVFSRPGAGTIVTGTLPAGELRTGEQLARGDEMVRVRGLQCLGQPVSTARGVCRVSIRLGSGAPSPMHRGEALTTPGAWCCSAVVDVLVDGEEALPRAPMLHIGAASVSSRLRVLARSDGATAARLSVDEALPWHVGDRILLRDPGRRLVRGASVLDPRPPPLSRRGDGRARGQDLLTWEVRTDAATEVRRRGVVHRRLLRELGVADHDVPNQPGISTLGAWLVDDQHALDLRRRMRQLVEERHRAAPLDHGVAVAELARSLNLPDEQLVLGLVETPLRHVDGRVTGADDGLPSWLLGSLRRLQDHLVANPFRAPDADELAGMSLDRQSLAVAARAGLVLRLSDTMVLLPGADLEAIRRLKELPQPFTASGARQVLDTTRRVVLPLLDHLDRTGLTRRLPDDRREVVQPPREI
jgi:selenocysteine-specific elongation factor